MSIMNRIEADLIEPQRLAGSVLDQARIERRRPGNNGRPLSSREALQAACFEVRLAAVAAENIARGFTLTDNDRARLLVAWARLEALATEAGA